MKRTKRIFAIVMAVAMVFCYMPSMAFAGTDEATTASDSAFVDMPQDWSTAGLENAVANGLLKGYEGTNGLEIRPAGTLTRAEMATVVNRAFGAADKASLSGVSDVVSGAWYADEMAKAVKMGTMKQDTQMRPNANITRQEAFTILGRAFKLVDADSNNAGLNAFSDKADVQAWAKDMVCALIDNNYVTGSNGMLNPTANITRAEFAKIMDNIVKQYITKAGTCKEVVATGNVMVNASGVTLENVTINGSLIIGDGVGSGEVTLNNVKVTGKTIVRGGGVNSIIIMGDSNIPSITVSKVDGNVSVKVQGNAKVNVVYINDGKDDVTISGNVTTLNVDSETPVSIKDATISNVVVSAADSNVKVEKGSTVTTMTVSEAAKGSNVAVAGTVTTLKSEAPKAKLSVTGTVTSVEISKTGTGTDVKVAKDAKVDKLDTSANVTTSGEGKPSSTTGSGSVDNKPGTTPSKPADGIGGGGGGGGGGGTTPTVNHPDFGMSDLTHAGQAVPVLNGIYQVPISALSVFGSSINNIGVKVKGAEFDTSKVYSMTVTVDRTAPTKATQSATIQNIAGGLMNQELTKSFINLQDLFNYYTKTLATITTGTPIKSFESFLNTQQVGSEFTVTFTYATAGQTGTLDGGVFKFKLVQ